MEFLDASQMEFLDAIYFSILNCLPVMCIYRPDEKFKDHSADPGFLQGGVHL
jgi:hypothetical protein